MARAGVHPTQGTPQSRSSGATSVPGAWASGKLLLLAVAVTGWHPCCLPGQLASLGQCGSLPLEESPSSRHSSSSSRSGSNRPGNPVPPGPSGEPLPLGTTARGHHRAGRALGEAHPPPQASPRRLRAPGIPINQVRRGDPRGQEGGWSGGQGWGRSLTQLSQGPVCSLPAAPVTHASLERDRAPCNDSPMAGGRSPGARVLQPG